MGYRKRPNPQCQGSVLLLDCPGKDCHRSPEERIGQSVTDVGQKPVYLGSRIQLLSLVPLGRPCPHWPRTKTTNKSSMSGNRMIRECWNYYVFLLKTFTDASFIASQTWGGNWATLNKRFENLTSWAKLSSKIHLLVNIGTLGMVCNCYLTITPRQRRIEMDLKG